MKRVAAGRALLSDQGKNEAKEFVPFSFFKFNGIILMHALEASPWCHAKKKTKIRLTEAQRCILTGSSYSTRCRKQIASLQIEKSKRGNAENADIAFCLVAVLGKN